MNVGDKQLVDGLIRLAYTGSGLGCLHNSTIALWVIILRRKRVESEENVGRRGQIDPTLLVVRRVAA